MKRLFHYLKTSFPFVFLCLFGVAFSSCATSAFFEDIGTNVASPTSFAVDSANRRLYVANSNSHVRYNPEQGNFQVLDITTPSAPTLLGTAQTKSFTGEIYFDSTAMLAYVANRYSANNSVTSDNLLTINVDESSADFLTLTETSTALDPFALTCCTPADTLLISTGEGKLQYVDTSVSPLDIKTLSLDVTLSTGITLSEVDVIDVVVIGTQAFLSLRNSGILVVNLDEITDTAVNAVDYFISDLSTPKGMATDGTNLIVADESVESGTFVSRVAIIDPSTLTALADNTTVTVVDKDDASLLLASINVGNDPQQVEVADGFAYVSNLEDDTVSVIDLSTNTVTKTITVGDQPFALGIDSPGGTPTTLYVSNLEGNSISIIDIATLTVTATYP